MNRRIKNEVTGDRIVFLASPLMGEGDRLIFRGILPPYAAGAPLHTHDEMVETFTVEQGALEIDLGEQGLRLLQVGDELVVQPGTPHGFRNPLDTETRFVTTATPGADLERFLRTMYGLANEGRTDRTGAPRNPLVMAAVLARMDMVMVGVSRALQRLAIGLLHGVARVTGVDADVAPYARPEGL